MTKINHKGLQKTANEYAEENCSKCMNKEIQGKPTSVRISSRVRGIWSQAYIGVPSTIFPEGRGRGLYTGYVACSLGLIILRGSCVLSQVVGASV